MSRIYFGSNGQVGYSIDINNREPPSKGAIIIVCTCLILFTIIILIIGYNLTVPSRDFICPNCGADEIDRSPMIKNKYKCWHYGCTIDAEHYIFNCENCGKFYHAGPDGG